MNDDYQSGWIGVDFDGTLAFYESGQWPKIGRPIEPMVVRVRRWLEAGLEIRIFTARASDMDQVRLIEFWCKEHLGQTLPVTDRKDFSMVELWDDRAIRVEKNTGRILGCEE